MKQSYYITAPASVKPWELKDALAEYKLDIQYAAEMYCTDGSTRAVRDFERFKAPLEKVALLASVSIVIASGFLLPPVVFAGSVATGSGLGFAAGTAGAAAGATVAAPKTPAFMLIEVTFRNVTVERIRWAEYALVTWCLLNRCELRGDLVEERNLVWAQHRLARMQADGQKPDMPVPWGSRKGKPARKSSKETAQSSKTKNFGQWLWGGKK